MFSTISKYTSPKQLLASYLSQSLAEFFDVDPNSVETNLLTNAKVALNNVKLKEQCHGRLLVHGSVDKIEFSWSWGTQALITNVTLTIEGVQILANVITEEEAKQQRQPINDNQAETPQPSKNAEREKLSSDDWKSRYLKQIIDCLTLIVRDATISIQMEDSSQIQLQGRNMELHTTHQQTESLIQKLKVGSLEAWILESSSDNTRHPILDPFGYHATVQRVSGQRFLDGILSGLFIQGDPDEKIGEAPSSIRVHAGSKQIAGLIRLQEVLLSVATTSEMANGDANNTNEADPELQQVPPPSSAHLDPTIVGNSVFCLPVQSMELVLENHTTLRLAGCTVDYCTDGSQLSVTCTQGIWMDDLPISKNNRWSLDLIACELLIDASQEDVFFDAESCESQTVDSGLCDSVPDFRLDLSIEMFEKLYLGVTAILPQCNHALELAETMMESQPTSSSSSWTLRANGILTFRFTGTDNLWLEVSAAFPKITQGNKAVPFHFDCESIKITSEAGGTSSVNIPKLHTTDGCLQVHEVIEMRATSLESITMLNNLANQVSSVMSDAQYDGSTDLPLDLFIPGISICIQGSGGGTVNIENVKGSGSSWNLSQLQASGFGGMETLAVGLELTLQNDIACASIDTINLLKFQEVNCLTAPLHKTKVSMKENKLDVRFGSLHVTSLDAFSSLKSDASLDLNQETKLRLPIDFKVSCEDLNIPLDNNKSVQIKNIECIVPTFQEHANRSLTLQCQSFDANLGAGAKLACAKIQAQAGFAAGPTDNADADLLTIPGMGAVFSANLKIGEISSLYFPGIGQLGEATTDISINLDKTKASLHAKTILLQCFETIKAADHLSDEATDTEKSVFHIPIDLVASIDEVCIASRQQKSLKIENFQGFVGAGSKHAQSFPVRMQVKSLQAQADPTTNISCKEIHLNGLFETSCCHPESSLRIGNASQIYVPKLTVKVGEISDASVASLGQLAKPTTEVVLEVNNNKASLILNSVLVRYPDMFKMDDVGEGGTEGNFLQWLPPFSIDVIAKRLMVMPEFGAGKPGVCFDGVTAAYANCPDAPENFSLSASCNYFQGRGPAEESLAVKDIRIQTMLDRHGTSTVGCLRRATGSIGEISTLKIPGIVELAKPLLQLDVLFEDSLVAIKCKEIGLSNLRRDASPTFTGSTDASAQAAEQAYAKAVPTDKSQLWWWKFPIRFKTDKFSVLSPIEPSGSNIHMAIDDVQLDMSNLSTLLMSRSIRVTSQTGFSMTINGVKIFGKWGYHVPNTDDLLLQLLSMPPFGILSSATVEIDEIKESSVPGIGSLMEPVCGSKFTFQDNTLSCTLDKVHVQSMMSSSSAHPGSPSAWTCVVPAVLLRIKYKFTAKCLEFDIDSEPSSPKTLLIQSIMLDFRPTLIPSQNTLLLRCDRVESQNAFGVSFAFTQLAFQAWLNKKSDIAVDGFICFPNEYIVEKASMTLKSVASFVIPGAGMLVEELENTNMSYDKDGLSVNIGDVDWALIDFEESVAEDSSVGYDLLTNIPIATAIAIERQQHRHFDFVPFPIRISVNTAKIESHKDLFAVGCKTVFFSIAPDPFEKSTCLLNLKCAVVKFESCDIAGAVGKGATLNATILPTTTASNDAAENHQQPLCCIPGTGHYVARGSLHVDELASLRIPGVTYLVDPVQGASLQYDGTRITCFCKSVVTRRDLTKRKPSSSSAAGPNLPCNVSIQVENASFEDVTPDRKISSKVVCSTLSLSLDPVLAKVTTSQQGPGAALYLKCQSVENTDAFSIVRIPDVSASGLIQFEFSDTIGNLVVSFDNVDLAADFSKWKSSESTPSNQSSSSSTQWVLPFALVKEFELNLQCTGTLVNVADAKIHCEPFNGDVNTNLGRIQSHYIAIVKRRIPYLLTKVDIAGSNVGDSISMVASSVATHSSVIGSTVGVVARDAVASTLSMGKSTRGASSSEKYKFGDLSRGMVASIKGAAARGSSMRGSDAYAFGDFSSGAASAASEYATRNSARLVGAGGSAAGMLAGAAVAGPIGLVAGSFLGGSAARSAVGNNPDKSKKPPAIAPMRTGGTGSEMSSTGMHHPLAASQTQTPDLLDSMEPFPTNTGVTNVTLSATTTDIQATWVGDVAATSQPSVMVQARVVEQTSRSYSAPANPDHTYNSADQHMYAAQTAMVQTEYLGGVPSSTMYSQVPGTGLQSAATQGSRAIPGSAASQRPMSTSRGTPMMQQGVDMSHQRPSSGSNPARQEERYRFGDVTRGIITRGRQLDGRDENSGYKFGDFTRGLFR